MRIQGWAAGLFIFSATASALAAGTDEKLSIGVRVGDALPSGRLSVPETLVLPGAPYFQTTVKAPATNLSDAVSAQVPITIDAGYLLTPQILLGAYGEYGFASSKQCETDCAAHDLRFGVQAQYRFLPARRLDPWIGVGAGYESLSYSVLEQFGGAGGTLPADLRLHLTYTGWELLRLQAGADIGLANRFTLGPFVGVSLAEFTHFKSDSADASIGNKAIHEWFTLGVKGSFGI